MKIIFSLFLIFSVDSCGQNDHPLLYGSWIMVVDPKYANSNIKDSVIFQKPDSLKIYMLQEGELVDSIFGKFYLNKDNLHLTTEYDNKKVEFEIVELTESSLKIKEVNKGVIQRYRRLSN